MAGEGGAELVRGSGRRIHGGEEGRMERSQNRAVMRLDGVQGRLRLCENPLGSGGLSLALDAKRHRLRL